MPSRFIFADEAGCFSFVPGPNVSRYFILCTVTMEDCELSEDLFRLRQSLIWRDLPVGDYFHASEDKQVIRNHVFETILKRRFEVQATILEKSKASSGLRESTARFFQNGYYLHFKQAVAPGLPAGIRALVTAASIGSKRERAAFRDAVQHVLSRSCSDATTKLDFASAESNACLQVADYCAWAISRKWERGDLRSYDLIADRVTYEVDEWQNNES